jgi:hypothetical protein
LNCTHQSAKCDPHAETRSLCITGRYERHILPVRLRLETPFRPDKEARDRIDLKCSEDSRQQSCSGSRHQHVARIKGDHKCTRLAGAAREFDVMINTRCFERSTGD